MSLASAVSNALSGVTATTRGTEVVSTNIANKSVAGYARRELELSSRIYAGNGGGVNVDGVRRALDAGLLADSRLAQSSLGKSDVTSTLHATVEKALGTANDPGSLTSVLTSLDSAIASASSRPDSEIRLSAVFDSANALAKKINRVAQTISEARTGADQGIAKDVVMLNEALDRVARLNRQITVMSAQGNDPSSLIDSRQATIDRISTLVPLQEVQRENGRVALFTKGGATLLDGVTPALIAFSATRNVTADMSVENNTLGRLSLNGDPLSDTEMSIFDGGSLAARFEVRDVLAPAYQVQIDAFARDLYSRFADPNVDPTLSTGDAGIFTDRQTAFAATNEVGFASRIAISARLDPVQGGDLWRIRAGMNAGNAGNAGESSIFLAMSSALTESRGAASPNISPDPRTLLGLASEISSSAASLRLRGEAATLQEQTRADSLRTALLSQGVDTDSQLEALLSLEKAYAANAKVLQTANDMLDQILRLT